MGRFAGGFDGGFGANETTTSRCCDPKAVRIEIEGETVGYLSRENARDYRDALRRAGHPRLARATCKANIRGGWDRGPDDRGHFGVWLDIPIQKQPLRQKRG